MKLSDLDLLVHIDDTVYKLEELKTVAYETNGITGEPSTDSIMIKLRGYLKEASDTDRIIAGYASVIEIDKEDQLIPKSTLEDGIETLIKNSDYANLMLVHQNIQVGKILDSYDKLTTHVDDNGLFIVCSIREDLEIANEIWEKITSGELNGFSIAAEVLVDHEECDSEKCITVIDKMNIFEISLCTQPVNAKSGFVVISKSELKDWVYDVCNDLNSEVNVNMAKKEKKQKVIEEKPEKVIEKSEEPCECVEKAQEEVVEEPIEEKSEPEPVPESVVEEKAPEENLSDIETIHNTIESLVREIEALKGIIAEMKTDTPVEEKAKEPTEEEDDEDDEEDMEKSEDIIEETSTEEKAEEVTLTIEDFDNFKADIQKSLSDLLEKFPKVEEIDDLKVAIKSKDEQIGELTKRLEIVENIEEKPKLKSDIKTKKQKKGLEFVKDPLRTGTYYKDLY